MADIKETNTEEQDERKLSPELVKQFRNRISVVKRGQEASTKGDHINTVRFYNQYLAVICKVYDTSIQQLNPKVFDQKKDLSEMLLISQVYWDLAKIYDKSDKLVPQLADALNQFVKFTLNYPYQVVNSEVLRRYLKNNKAKHRSMFQQSHAKIFVSSKRCYVAEYAFGEFHHVTDELRLFKKDLAKHRVGLKFIEQYYRYSPSLIRFSRNNPLLGGCLKRVLFRPMIRTFIRIKNMI